MASNVSAFEFVTSVSRMKATIEQPQRDVPAEPQFLLEWTHEGDAKRWFEAGAGSVVIHIVLLFAGLYVASLPPTLPRNEDPIQLARRNVTPLVAPQLTQPEPNKAPVNKEFNLGSLSPHSQPSPSSTPGAEAAARRVLKFNPPAPVRQPIPSPVLAEAPTIDPTQLHTAQPQPLPLGTPQMPAPPQIQPEEKPKLAFEKPGIPTGVPNGQGLARVPAAPKNTVQEAVKSVARGSRNSAVIGDDEDSIVNLPGGIRANPMPGRLGSSLELVSDPMGVDFRPYLIRVLASVRRNWYAVIPESARLGRTGKVIIQFAIAKDGNVPKLVIAVPSGADPLDRAAVAGISASNPFPPLPSEFRGNQIRLQLAFDYKMSPAR